MTDHTKLRALLAAATPGPWKSMRDGNSYAVEPNSWRRDHSCAQCVPDGPIVVAGFECGRHVAMRIANRPATPPAPRVIAPGDVRPQTCKKCGETYSLAAEYSCCRFSPGWGHHWAQPTPIASPTQAAAEAILPRGGPAPAVYARAECPFKYCDSPDKECERASRCHHAGPACSMCPTCPGVDDCRCECHGYVDVSAPLASPVPARDAFSCCGGNDEKPPHHCSDCPVHPWPEGGGPDPVCMSAPEACPHASPAPAEGILDWLAKPGNASAVHAVVAPKLQPLTRRASQAPAPTHTIMVGGLLGDKPYNERGTHAVEAPAPAPCRKYLGDNDGTCPQLTCVRDKGHAGDCDNMRGDAGPAPVPDATCGDAPDGVWRKGESAPDAGEAAPASVWMEYAWTDSDMRAKAWTDTPDPEESHRCGLAVAGPYVLATPNASDEERALFYFHPRESPLSYDKLLEDFATIRTERDATHRAEVEALTRRPASGAELAAKYGFKPHGTSSIDELQGQLSSIAAVGETEAQLREAEVDRLRKENARLRAEVAEAEARAYERAVAACDAIIEHTRELTGESRTINHYDHRRYGAIECRDAIRALGAK